MSVHKPLAILATLLIAAAFMPAAALADGDPASDVLLGESVFYPLLPARLGFAAEDAERRDGRGPAGRGSRSRSP